jgi:hypothetical protein
LCLARWGGDVAWRQFGIRILIGRWSQGIWLWFGCRVFVGASGEESPTHGTVKCLFLTSVLKVAVRRADCRSISVCEQTDKEEQQKVANQIVLIRWFLRGRCRHGRDSVAKWRLLEAFVSVWTVLLDNVHSGLCLWSNSYLGWMHISVCVPVVCFELGINSM